MDNPTAKSIKRFSELVRALPDADLERDWAWGSYKSEGIRFAYFRAYEDLRDLAVQIGHQRAISGEPWLDAQRILAQYHAAYRDLEAVLLGVESQYYEIPPAEGEWPVRRVLAHVVGADMGFYVAIKFALDRYQQGADPLIEIEDETWLEIIGLEDDEVDAKMAEALPGLQSYHEELHQRIMTDFSGIADYELEKSSRYWEDEMYSLRFRLHRFDAHMRQHTIQMEKTLQVLGHVPGESEKLLRLIFAALAQVEGALIGTGETYQELLSESAVRIDERTREIEDILVS
jgi:uncharacterized damage-inducible protein DinB